MKTFLIGLVILVALGAKAAPNVVAWGANGSGQTNVPPDLTNAVAVAAGGSHSLALRADGTVAAWGNDGFGQTDVPPGLSNVVAISTRRDYSLALRADGTVAAWGTKPASLPWLWVGCSYSGLTNAPAGLSNVVAVAAGLAHGMALRADGSVTVWGDGSAGQTNVPAGLNNVVAIAAGDAHCVALKADGTVVGWGMWLFPTHDDPYYAPVNVPAGLSDVVAIAAGTTYALALRAERTAAVWNATFGGTVFQTVSNAVGVAAGGSYVVLHADGTVEPSIPGLSNVVAVACGYAHTLALIGSGPPVVGPPMRSRQVAAGAGTAVFYAPGVGQWPLSYQWQLNGTNLPGATSPWLVVTGGLPAQAGLYSVLLSNAVGVAASAGAALEVAPVTFEEAPQDQVIYLGGTARFGAQVQTSQPLSSLGYQWRFNGKDLPGQTNASLVLPDVDWPQQGGYSLLVSNALGSVLSRPAELALVNVAGWGFNWDEGFDINTIILTGQATVPAGLTDAVEVAACSAFSLALRAGGTVVAWGDDRYGQTDVPEGLSGVVAIAAGGAHSLALRADGTVTAWGDSSRGQTNVPPGLSNVVAIAGGGFQSLAVRVDRSVVAWGGNGPESAVPAGLSNVVAIAAGLQSIALRADGTVAAWGDNSRGQTNVPPGLSNVVAIACGAVHCCALRSDGVVIAWGDNSRGQTNVPPGLSNVAAVACGGDHSLAVRSDGTVVAWGADDYGQADVPPDLRNVRAVAGGGGYSLALVGEGPPVLNALLADPCLSNGVFSVSLPTRNGRVYALEFKNALSDSAWSPLPLVAGKGRTQVLADPTASSAARFYRVRQW